MVGVQYCDGGPLDQAIKNSRFKRTMVSVPPALELAEPSCLSLK